MKKNTWTYILGFLLIFFGIMFIISPTGTFRSIVLVAGIVLIVYSVIGIKRGLLSKDLYSSYFIGGYVIGLIFGIILATHTEGAIKLVSILLGIWLFISGLSPLIMAIKTKADSKIIISLLPKVIIGLIALLLPIIPVITTGIFVGVILILSGITTITNAKNDEIIYKVKVKK